MFYTGRYSDKRINNNEYFVVRISLGLPKYNLPYVIDYELRLAMPNWNMMKKENFEELYGLKLEENKYAIINKISSIKRLAGDKKILFLCFEKVINGNECHRIHFGNWLCKNIGEDFIELDLNCKPRKLEQLKLL